MPLWDFAISKEIEKDLCEIFVKFDLFTTIYFLSRRVRAKRLKYSQIRINRSRISRIFTSRINLRGPGPLATNRILFLCVSRIL